jgi:hypothetical protein
LEILNQFVAECDRRTEHAKRKLKETQEELGEEAARKVTCLIDARRDLSSSFVDVIDEFNS